MKLERVAFRIFTGAVEMPLAERDAYIKDQCGDNAALAERVLTLLEIDATDDDVLRDPVSLYRDRFWEGVLSDEQRPSGDLSGTIVGVWSIDRPIARGGLATVYLAERNDGAYKKTVAFKALRRGLDTDDLVRRFQAEREILASLEHEAISRILDGGALADGRPYLVLEYVNGVPINEYCRDTALDIHGRARLMVDVAYAIAHAHRHLVVHRDIKPGNILVDQQGKVCLLDFGIAKLLDPDIGPESMPCTRTGVTLLTPAYASPEQLAKAAVTTASDIYQLGLVFHELLTGELPFDDREDRQYDLPPPSQQMKNRGERRQVMGDLDSIVRKATHHDPEQRYASADQMAADIERHLQGRPILARPDTLAYRLRKLHGRKPWLGPAVVLALLFLSAGIYMESVYSERLERERDLSMATTEFLLGVFNALNPYVLPGSESGAEITIVNALNIGARRARAELADQPELRASLLRTISEVHSSLDSNEAALDLREELLQLERDLYGDRSTQVIESLRALAALHSRLGDRSLADEFQKRQMALSREVFPADSPEMGLAEIALGSHEIYYGEIVSGRSRVASGIRKLEPQKTTYPTEYIGATILLAGQNGMEDIDESLAIIQSAYELAEEVFGPGSLHLTTVQLRLASTLTDKGDFENSERHFLAAIPILESQLGKDHAVTMNAINNLGYLYARMGEQSKAEILFADLLERQVFKFGPVSRQVADSTQNLAGAVTKQGRYDESIPLHWQAHQIFNQVIGPDHYVAAFPLLSIAFAELQRGQAAESEAAARRARQIFESAMPDSFLVGVASCLTGLAMEQQGEVRKGAAMVAASRELMRKGSVPDPYPQLCGLASDSE